MSAISPWTIAGAIIGLVALVVLFFPFLFRIKFRLDMSGVHAGIFLFKKKLFEADKRFNGDEKPKEEPEEDVVPTYVPPPKKSPDEPVKKQDEKVAEAPSRNAEKLAALKAAETGPVESQEEPEETSEPQETPKAKPPRKDKKKRKLTETEFWNILLTPEFDSSAFWAVKKLLASLFKLFHIKFEDCFVEGIQSDYDTMGYGAALNGFLKSFPFFESWDFRMDWTRDHELLAQGEVRASVNLCRILGLLLTTLFLGGFIAFKFWRRRAHVLKTHELVELGFVRSKIVKMMAEE